jgi:hypothetical protein
MVEFKSPLGTKTFSGQGLKEFNIPDGDQFEQMPVQDSRNRQFNMQDLDLQHFNESAEDVAEVERQMRVAREAKRTGKERLNDGAKRRIEMLLGITRTTRQFKIGDTDFVIKTLKSKEMRESVMAASEFDGTVQYLFELRRQFLARSLVEIGGIEVNQFVGSNSVEARYDLIDNLDDAVLNKLYDEYSLLTKEANDKYSIKTTEEATQVVEDLKK